MESFIDQIIVILLSAGFLFQESTQGNILSGQLRSKITCYIKSFKSKISRLTRHCYNNKQFLIIGIITFLYNTYAAKVINIYMPKKTYDKGIQ